MSPDSIHFLTNPLWTKGYAVFFRAGQWYCMSWECEPDEADPPTSVKSLPGYKTAVAYMHPVETMPLYTEVKIASK